MKRTWLVSSICLVSIAAACSSDGGGGGDDTAGTGGEAGTAGTASGGTAGTASGGTSGAGGSSAGSGGTGGISFGGTSSGGTSGAGGSHAGSGGTGGSSGGTGGSSGGTGGTGGSSGGTGGTSNAGNPCSNTTWVFTPNSICQAPNPSCGFDATQRLPQYAIDGNPATRYTSGKQQDGTEEFTLVFTSSVTISGITLTTATAGDAPAMYDAQYSTDGTTYMEFTPAVTGAGAATTAITFPATTMKAIKIKQTGTTTMAWWSINEITLTGCMKAN